MSQSPPRVASTRDIGTRITSAPFGQTRGRYGYQLLAVGAFLMAPGVGEFLGWAVAK